MEFAKYRDRYTKEVVKVMRYQDINDFPKLSELIGDIYPQLSKAQTRIYEDKWVVRYANNVVKFIDCPNNDDCFNRKYEIYK